MRTGSFTDMQEEKNDRKPLLRGRYRSGNKNQPLPAALEPVDFDSESSEGEQPSATWQEKNGCLLLHTNTDPHTLKLDSLPPTNAAFLIYRREVWYVKKQRNWLDRLLLTPERFRVVDAFKDHELFSLDPPVVAQRGKENEHNLLHRKTLNLFDLKMMADAKQQQHLTDEEIEQVAELTGHTHKTAWQKFLHCLGIFCTAFIAVGCGVSTAASFIALNLVTGGLAGVGAALLFLTGTAVNWWIFKRYTPAVLIDLFGREKFAIDKKGDSLPPHKKFALGVALTLSLAVGATFGALTYVSTFTLSTAFTFLVAISPALPPIAGILAGVTLICMTALMFKDIADLIKQKDVPGACWNFAKNLVSTSQKLPQNKGKSPERILLERGISIVLTILFIPLACVGLYMTMNACAPGVKNILLDKIPSLSVFTADVLASVIARGFSFVGQIPFGIQAAFQTIAKLFGPKSEEGALQKPFAERMTNGIIKLGKLFCVATNAVGNGFISMMGAHGLLFRMLALISGTANSAFAGIPAVLGKKRVQLKPTRDDIGVDKISPAAKLKRSGKKSTSAELRGKISPKLPPLSPLPKSITNSIEKYRNANPQSPDSAQSNDGLEYKRSGPPPKVKSIQLPRLYAKDDAPVRYNAPKPSFGSQISNLFSRRTTQQVSKPPEEKYDKLPCHVSRIPKIKQA